MALAWFVFGCGAAERAPNLVELRELGPRHVEVGDRLRLTGSGFPEGRPAKLVLRGDLLRAGEAPQKDVELVAQAQLASPHALEIVVSDAFANAVCGTQSQRHTTFRGDVEVAFSPRTSAGSVVSGRLDGVVVDIAPDFVHPDALAALRSEGSRFAEFEGAELSPTEDGLAVLRLEPKGRAARGGMAVGDVVLELDGMVVRGVADLIPPPNAKTSLVLVRRGPETRTLRLESAGFRYSSPEILRPAIALLGALLMLFLVLRSPVARALCLFERRLLERLRGQGLPAVLGDPSRARAQALVRALLAELPESFLPYVALVATSALFTLLALGKSVVLAELDLLVIPAGTLAGFFCAAFATRQEGRRWSFRLGLQRSFAVLALNLPLAALLVLSAVRVGSLRTDEVVAAQGALPWQWQAFQSPLLSACALLSLLGLVPFARAVSVLGWQRRPSRRERLVSFAQWVHQLVSAGVLSVVALGGFQLPGAQESLVVQIFGALVLLAKCWSVIGWVALVRAVVGCIDVATLGTRVLLIFVGASAGSVMLSLLLYSASSSPLWTTLSSELGPLLFGAGLTALAWLSFRVTRGIRAPSLQAGVQPWL